MQRLVASTFKLHLQMLCLSPALDNRFECVEPVEHERPRWPRSDAPRRASVVVSILRNC